MRFCRRARTLISSELRERCVVVAVGEPHLGTSASAALRHELTCHAHDFGGVVLDLREVETVDSGGLGALVAALRTAGPKRELVLSEVSIPVLRSIEIAGLKELFPVFATTDEALRATAQLLQLHQALWAEDRDSPLAGER